MAADYNCVLALVNTKLESFFCVFYLNINVQLWTIFQTNADRQAPNIQKRGRKCAPKMDAQWGTAIPERRLSAFNYPKLCQMLL